MCEAAIARAGRASLAGLVFVILSVSLADATFGPRTTIGKNYQQWSNTPSENGFDSDSCSNAPVCYVLFQPIPQQQPLIVQHVACRAFVTAGDLQFAYLGTRKGQTLVVRHTPFVPVSTTGGNWAVTGPVMHLIKSGERPYVFFANS